MKCPNGLRVFILGLIVGMGLLMAANVIVTLPTLHAPETSRSAHEERWPRCPVTPGVPSLLFDWSEPDVQVLSKGDDTKIIVIQGCRTFVGVAMGIDEVISGYWTVEEEGASAEDGCLWVKIRIDEAANGPTRSYLVQTDLLAELRHVIGRWRVVNQGQPTEEGTIQWDAKPEAPEWAQDHMRNRTGALTFQYEVPPAYTLGRPARGLIETQEWRNGDPINLSQVWDRQGSYSRISHDECRTAIVTSKSEEDSVISRVDENGRMTGFRMMWGAHGWFKGADTWESNKMHGAFVYFDKHGALSRYGVAVDGQIAWQEFVSNGREVDNARNSKPTDPETE